MWDAKKDELLAAWRSLIDRRGVSVQTRETVEEVKRLDGSRFEVRTTRKLYRAQRVVLAIGTRGKPRRLGVPGESSTKVSALLGDAADHRGQRVLVVGGGDSAVEAAIALADTAARVTLSYRGKQLSRCKNANRVRLAELEHMGRVVVRFSTQIAEIKQELVKLRRADGRRRAREMAGGGGRAFRRAAAPAPDRADRSTGRAAHRRGARDARSVGAGGGARRSDRGADRHPLPRRARAQDRLTRERTVRV